MGLCDRPQARRIAGIQPFRVMALLARARALEAEGRSIVHMEIGEPDFTTPEPVIEAGRRALAEGKTHYTPAAGLPELREAIAGWYRDCHGVEVSPGRILVTPGASGALQLTLSVLVNPGDGVLMPDPCYPCNRNFVRLVEGEAVTVPVDAQNAYQLTPEQMAAHADAGLAAVLLASPANPTGMLVDQKVLEGILRVLEGCGACLVMDEIYHGLVYEGRARTALASSDRVFVINGFSKYFGMTGWRVGWLVAPAGHVEALDRLAQNLFLAAPTVAQHAALAAFGPETQAILEERREALRRRRDFLLAALREIGFGIPVEPQGAFYLYADCSRFTEDSEAFTHALLEEAGVAVTPGADFGFHQAARHVRFSYTTSMDRLEEGVERIRRFVATGGGARSAGVERRRRRRGGESRARARARRPGGTWERGG